MSVIVELKWFDIKYLCKSIHNLLKNSAIKFRNNFWYFSCIYVSLLLMACLSTTARSKPCKIKGNSQVTSLKSQFMYPKMTLMKLLFGTYKYTFFLTDITIKKLLTYQDFLPSLNWKIFIQLTFCNGEDFLYSIFF